MAIDTDLLLAEVADSKVQTLFAKVAFRAGWALPRYLAISLYAEFTSSKTRYNRIRFVHMTVPFALLL